MILYNLLEVRVRGDRLGLGMILCHLLGLGMILCHLLDVRGDTLSFPRG